MAKGSFGFQVATVCGVLAIAGVMFYIIAHQSREDTPRSEVARVLDVPVYAVPTTAPATRGAEVINSRFTAEPDFTADPTQTAENWTSGTIEGKTAWLDNQSGMIWGPRLDASYAEISPASFKKASEACAAETPAGVWALPTAGEFDIAKVNGILKADSGARHRWISYQHIYNTDMASGRGYVSANAEKEFSVRCVARSAKAPQDGYMEAGNEITLKAMSE